MREKIFANENHKNNYKKLMQHIDKQCRGSERIQAMVYLLALLETIKPGFAKTVFDFENLLIRPDVLNEPWQTSSTRRTILLAFNLFGDYPATIQEIFGYSYWDEYYCEAIRIRFPHC